jgi:hypothetical protein
MVFVFEDDEGRLLTDDDINDLPYWEIATRQLHVYERRRKFQ